MMNIVRSRRERYLRAIGTKAEGRPAGAEDWARPARTPHEDDDEHAEDDRRDDDLRAAEEPVHPEHPEALEQDDHARSEHHHRTDHHAGHLVPATGSLGLLADKRALQVGKAEMACITRPHNCRRYSCRASAMRMMHEHGIEPRYARQRRL